MPDLVTRLGVDFFSASMTAATISPVIFMIDKSIMEATSGKATSILASVQSSASSIIRHPLVFCRSVPFLLLYSVYLTTYCTVNFVDTASTVDATEVAAWSKQTNGIEKFLVTTSLNLSVCVYKDMRYAKFYGMGQPRKMPAASLLLFAARDSLTIFASFNVPPLLAPIIGLNVAQIVTPCAMQFFSTPLHLLGLDVYNRADESAKSRWGTVSRGYWRSSFARVCRILPAFGVGGVLNRRLRETGMGMAHAHA